MSEIRYPFRVRKVVQVPIDRVPGYIYVYVSSRFILSPALQR